MAKNWATQEERGTSLGIYLIAWVYRLLGRHVCLAIMAPVVFFFYLNGAEQRRASRAYLERAWRSGLLKRKPGFWTGYRHFFAFSGSMLDKLASWLGHIRPENVEGAHDGLFDAAKKSGRGAVLLTSHLGNPEVIRAVATVNRRFKVTVLVHTANAERFNKVINNFSGESSVRLLQVKDIDMATAMRLSEAISRGEWVVVAADRLPPTNLEAPRVAARFLGDDADFPAGPFILASALKCPAFFMASMRTGSGFQIIFRPFDDPVNLPRRARGEALSAYVQTYADMLVDALALSPLQWFNFYDYWGDEGASGEDTPRGNAEGAGEVTSPAGQSATGSMSGSKLN